MRGLSYRNREASFRRNVYNFGCTWYTVKELLWDYTEQLQDIMRFMKWAAHIIMNKPCAIVEQAIDVVSCLQIYGLKDGSSVYYSFVFIFSQK